MKKQKEPTNFARTMHMVSNPYAFGSSLACFLHVAVECAIYVWLPTYLKSYAPSSLLMATYAISIFVVSRVGRRFLGAWMLNRWPWTHMLDIFSGAILACFLGAMVGGPDAVIYLLALSGVFMSVIYPTLSSKDISCFSKAEHGAIFGIILFFTCAGAVVGPLAAGAVRDAFGDLRAGFVLATAFSAVLFAGLLYNWAANPTRMALQYSDATEYGVQ